MLSTTDIEVERLTAALDHYQDDLLRRVAGKLFRPRINQPREEILEKLIATYGNPPVLDRCLLGLPPEARQLLALIGRTRQPHWRVSDLLALLSSFPVADAFNVIDSLLKSGLIVAEAEETIHEFSVWYVANPNENAVILPATVSNRAATLPLEFNAELEAVKVDEKKSPPLPVDGLEWPLRIALAWQQVHTLPVKMTQAGGLYKRDLTRFEGDALLNAAISETARPLPDAGLFALAWAHTSGSLKKVADELHAAPLAADNGILDALTNLFASLFKIAKWDPLHGSVDDRTQTAASTAGVLLLGLLAERPREYRTAIVLANWLWEHHPHWSGMLPKDSAKSVSGNWVENYFLGVLVPLRIVEVVLHEDTYAYRLGDLGRHLLANEPLPAVAPAFPQTLLVQPNAEVLVYRQGLSPALIAKLAACAAWKQIGAACTLELTSDSIGRGLGTGLTLGDIIQTLDRHGMKPMPANVADLLRRWADKRERLSVYASATLVEFNSPADLDVAINRGIVTVRLTDRIGLTSNGADPDFAHLRLTGNRDYEAKPQQCVVAADDGVTLIVDATASDLLLEAELVKFTEPQPGSNGSRSFRMTKESLHSAANHGMTLEDLNDWCVARSGEPVPAAAKLLFGSQTAGPLSVETVLVLNTPTEEIADGLVQLPATSPYIVRRLGPTAVVIEREQLAALREVLQQIGLTVPV
ncbi:hypothetical protein BH11PLA2_BH11PLA2_19480 [soil metagenome]